MFVMFNIIATKILRPPYRGYVDMCDAYAYASPSFRVSSVFCHCDYLLLVAHALLTLTRGVLRNRAPSNQWWHPQLSEPHMSCSVGLATLETESELFVFLMLEYLWLFGVSVIQR